MREFCSVHFNWPQSKADEHLLPVMQVRSRWWVESRKYQWWLLGEPDEDLLPVMQGFVEVSTSYVTTYYSLLTK